MSPSIRQIVTGSVTTGTSVSAAFTQQPQAVSTLLLAAMSYDTNNNGATVSAPTGWELLTTVINDAPNLTGGYSYAGLALYYKTPSSTDALNWTFGCSFSNYLSLALLEVSGVLGSVPQYVSNTTTTSSSGAAVISSPTLNLTANNSLPLLFVAGNGHGLVPSATAGTGYSIAASVPSLYHSLFVASGNTAASTSASATLTINVADNYPGNTANALVALAPAPVTYTQTPNLGTVSAASYAISKQLASAVSSTFVPIISGSKSGATIGWVLDTYNGATSLFVYDSLSSATNSYIARIDPSGQYTPLAGASGATSKYSQNLGDGTNTVFTVTHNLNSVDVLVQFRDNQGNAGNFASWQAATADTIIVTFSSVPVSNAYRVTVIG